MSHKDLYAFDVVDAFIESICVHCPHYAGLCMPSLDEEGDNFVQMINCIDHIKEVAQGNYPAAGVIVPYMRE